MSGIFDFIKKNQPQSNKNVAQNSISSSNYNNSTNQKRNYSFLEENQVESSNNQGQKDHNTVKPNNQDLAVKTSQKPVNFSNDSNLNKNNKPENHQTQLDLMTHLTQRSNRILFIAQNKARELKHQFVDSEHLLFGLLSDNQIYNLLVEIKLPSQIIESELSRVFNPGNYQGQPKFSPRLIRIIDGALVLARKLGYEFISPEHLLLSLFEEGEGLGARILVKVGLNKEELNKKIIGKKEGLEAINKEKEKKKSNLERFTIDLTYKAQAGLLDPVVERSSVIERVIHILSRRTKNNPALIGEAGVGKTAIVEGLAQKIVSKQVPEPLLNKKILQLDLMSVLAGASHRGEFEERMKNLIEEVKQNQGQIILFIDEIHNIVGAGSSGEGSLDASNFLKPALARGEIQLIGATTITEYRRYIEKDPALERRFQPVLVPEPTEEQAIKMLFAIKPKYEAYHRVIIPQEAIEAAVRLSKRYIGDRFLPDKAVDLIDEAASAVRLPLISLPEEIASLEERIAKLSQELNEIKTKNESVKSKILRSKIDELISQLKEKQEEFNLKKAQSTTQVTVEVIREIIARWTGIPVTKITASETEKLANLELIMHERMVNQERAVKAVAEAVRRGRAGLKSAQRPIGSFVFLGPTGVGKTELAKTLADVLFGQEEAMIRFDMTEYMEKHEVAKLLGAPPGYVGYEEGGKLTEAVRRKPYSVVLFDEVEKAHPDIFNILLQILDDGRLTDNKGHVVSFKNTVVICTSNIGTKTIQDELLKTGGNQVSEPRMISTFTLSNDGRIFVGLDDKFLVLQNGIWEEIPYDSYFKPEDFDKKNKDLKIDFNSFNFKPKTHSFGPKGIEVVFDGLNFLLRSLEDKEPRWEIIPLEKYFKNQKIESEDYINDEDQFPKVIDTHTFSPNEEEMITSSNYIWIRKIDSDVWKKIDIKDYLASKSISIHGLPLDNWEIHTFDQGGNEFVFKEGYVWKNINGNWVKIMIQNFLGEEFPWKQIVNYHVKKQEIDDQKNYEKIKEKVMEELRKFFRPELINRFDEVIVFEPLKFKHMKEIVRLQLKGLAKILEEQEIGFSVTDEAVKQIVKEGFDPIYGARPLRRAIQKLIENPISSMIIEGKLKAGKQLFVDFDGEKMTFEVSDISIFNQDAVFKIFICLDCDKNFKTEYVLRATYFCPKCLSRKIKELSFPDENDLLTQEFDDDKEINSKLNNTKKPSSRINSNYSENSYPNKKDLGANFIYGQ